MIWLRLHVAVLFLLLTRLGIAVSLPYGLIVQGDEPITNEQSLRLLTELATIPKELLISQTKPLAPLVLNQSQQPRDCLYDERSYTPSISLGAHLRHELTHHLLHRFDDHYQFSQSEQWRQLSGWQSQHLLRPTTWDHEADNQNPLGYADALGITSPQHDFVTYAEAYLLETDLDKRTALKCVMPRKYEFLSQVISSQTNQLDQGITCPEAANAFLADITFRDPILGSEIDMGPIDPAHVLGFELLYATPGTNDIAEVAGHLLLRVKLDNNPQAKILGIENPHDLVISFLADTEPQATEHADPASCKDQRGTPKPKTVFDPLKETLQALRGLTGGLGLVMHRATLVETLYNYTIFQDRDLLRYELVLTEEQKATLIARLYEAKLNYASRYFFFDSNCASILTKIIGEGISKSDMEVLSAPVVPPNALVAMLIRKQLARRATPAFFSYRRQGIAASLAMKPYIFAAGMPELRGLLDGDEATRKDIYSNASANLPSDIQRLKALYKVAQLGQTFEMKEYINDDACVQITNDAMVAARQLQKAILANLSQQELRDQKAMILAAQSSRHEIEEELLSAETANLRGTEHTHLLWLGVNMQQQFSTAHGGYGISGGLFRQEMGSLSRYAMQRTGHIRLGEFAATQSADGRESSLRLQGLQLEKLRENLDTTPSVFTDPTRLGLTLKLLDFTRSNHASSLHSKLVLGGAGVMINLASSSHYDSFLQVGLGLNAYKEWKRSDELDGQGDKPKDWIQLEMPITVKGQLGLNQERTFVLTFGTEWLVGEDNARVNPSETYVRLGWLWHWQERGWFTFGGIIQDPQVDQLKLNTMQLGVEVLSH